MQRLTAGDEKCFKFIAASTLQVYRTSIIYYIYYEFSKTLKFALSDVSILSQLLIICDFGFPKKKQKKSIFA